MMRRSVLLALVACRPTAVPSPVVSEVPPAAPEVAPPQLRERLATRPGFLECAYNSGPARPIGEREAHHWLSPQFRRGKWIGSRLPIIEEIDATLALATAGQVATREHTERHLHVGMEHFTMADEFGAVACRLERAEEPRQDELQRQWYLADHHLRHALEHARAAWLHAELLDAADQSAYLQCLGTLAATRLGELDEALVASASLVDQVCADTALAWLGDALDRRGRSAEARALFARVLAHDHDSHFDMTCPVVPPDHLEMYYRPNPFEGSCRWRWYVRYRLVHLDLRAGTLTAADAVAALVAIASQHVEGAAGATLHAAIQADIAVLRVAP